MKWVFALLIALSASSWASQPRYPNPQSPDEVWQNDLDLYDRVRRASSSGIVGQIIMWPTTTAPENFLNCDGTAISRTTYAGLFAVLGTTYGVGDGSTTFNLPDLRGRSPMGSGTGSGLTARTIGAKLGAENHQHRQTTVQDTTGNTPYGTSDAPFGTSGAATAYDIATHSALVGPQANKEFHLTDNASGVHPVQIINFAICYQ